MLEDTVPVVQPVVQETAVQLYKKGYKYDWLALEAEYKSNTTYETLNQFRIRHGIQNQNKFYLIAKRWELEKANLQRKALEKSARKKTREYYDKAIPHIQDAYLGLIGNAKKTVADTIDNGQVVRALSTREQLQLAESLDKILKASRLMAGLSTGDKEKEKQSVDVNMAIRLLLEDKNEKKIGEVIDVGDVDGTVEHDEHVFDT